MNWPRYSAIQCLRHLPATLRPCLVIACSTVHGAAWHGGRVCEKHQRTAAGGREALSHPALVPGSVGESPLPPIDCLTCAFDMCIPSLALRESVCGGLSKYLLKYISHGLFQKELLPVQVVSGIFNSGQKCPSRMHAPSRTPLLLPLLLSHNLPTPRVR